jgi:hypothetical protein
MPPPRRCYEVIAISIFREGSRPSGCPRPMRRSWLQRNRLLKPSGALTPCRRVFAFALSHISLVKFRSGGLGHSNAKTGRLILPAAQNPAFCRSDTGCRYQASPHPIRASPPAVQRRHQSDKPGGNYPENVGGKYRDPLHFRMEHSPRGGKLIQVPFLPDQGWERLLTYLGKRGGSTP